MKNKKKILIIVGVLLLISLVITYTYSLFVYNKTSTNSKLIVGDVYMHYNEDNEGIVINETDSKELAYSYLNWKNGGGYKRCEACGRLFRNNRYRKYCHECSKYQPIGDKTLECIDCGKEFTVDSRNMTKCRCDECQREKDKENTRLRVQKFRNKQTM